MLDFLDDLLSPADEPRDRTAPVTLGLVVSEKAESGEALSEEARLYAAAGAEPTVIFVDEDEQGREIFADDAVTLPNDGTRRGQQSATFADAMGLPAGQRPTPSEAIAWSNARCAAAIIAHHARIKP
jgi:hypothetical protein